MCYLVPVRVIQPKFIIGLNVLTLGDLSDPIPTDPEYHSGWRCSRPWLAWRPCVRTLNLLCHLRNCNKPKFFISTLCAVTKAVAKVKQHAIILFYYYLGHHASCNVKTQNGVASKTKVPELWVRPRLSRRSKNLVKFWGYWDMTQLNCWSILHPLLFPYLL